MRSPIKVLDNGAWPGPAGPAAPQVEIVVPVRNEERDLAPSIRRLHAYLCDRFPFTARITIADNGSTDGTWAQALALAGQLDLVRAVRLDQPGRGPGAAHGLVGQRVRSPRVHGRRPVDRPERAAAARRATAFRSQRRGDRHQAGAGRAGDPRPAPRDHLPLLQPAPARHAPGQVLGRAVRVQGDPRRQGPPAAGADRGHRLVLRHRAAGARRARRVAHPRGAGRLDRRQRLPGRRACDGPRRHSRRHPHGRRAPAHQLPRRRRGLHDRLRAAVPGPPRRDGGAGGERAEPAGHRSREYRAEPELHVRGPRAAARRPPPAPRAAGVRRRAAAHLRCAGRPASGFGAAWPRCRGGRARRRPTCWRRCCGTRCTGAGSSAADRHHRRPRRLRTTRKRHSRAWPRSRSRTGGI